MAADIISFIQPMMALPVRDLPTGNWIYEMKFDGYRALAIKADKEVRLISRNRKSFNDDYPVLVDSLKSLKTKSFTMDGEITALDENGRSSSQLLQGYGKASRPRSTIMKVSTLALRCSTIRIGLPSLCGHEAFDSGGPVQWERFKEARLVKVRLLLPGKVGTVEATHALSSQNSKSITGNGSGIALPA